MTGQTFVTYEHHDRVACITLSRPEAGNAINRPMFEQLTRALEKALEDDDVWVVLLRGQGKDFCLGADYRATDEESLGAPRRTKRPFMGEYYEHAEEMRKWWMWLWDFTKPIVTEIQGDAIGWGADLALISHTSIASSSARIGDTSIRMGLVTQNPIWSWRIGPRRARQYLMTGDMIEAEKACEIGAITKVVADEELADEALLAAGTIAYQGGIVGWDGNWLGRRGFFQATQGARGISQSWVTSGSYSALSAIQRRGFQAGEFDFEGRREAVGADAAIEEMEVYYRPSKAQSRG